jgi:hypothetical protein
MKFTKKVLPNGLTIIEVPGQDAESVARLDAMPVVRVRPPYSVVVLRYHACSNGKVHDIHKYTGT